MQDLFENAKRAANTAVERAAWEADKMRRATARQREMDLAQRERATLIEQLATVVLDLDKRGQLTQDALKMLAQRLRILDSDIATGQSDIQTIRGETFKPGTISIQVTRTNVPEAQMPCPTCGKLIRQSASFCPSCGARLS